MSMSALRAARVTLRGGSGGRWRAWRVAGVFRAGIMIRDFA